MIVVDLDGTILKSDGKVSSLTKQYLKNLKDKGYIITIATGRIYASALKVTDGADFANYIISDTGSCIYDKSNSNLVFSNFINSEIASRFFNYYNEDCCYINFCDKNTIYKYSDEEQCNEIIKTTKNKEYIMSNCKKISHITISMKNNDAVKKCYSKLINDFKELEIIIMQDSFSDRQWIEIMSKGSSKYNRIKDLAQYLKISNEEIISFGDGLNDIEMLEKCGYGVALKNALPEVKEKATDVTIFDHNNDGVINYLRELLYDDRKV